MTLDTGLPLASVMLDLMLLSQLFTQRVYRTLPAFFAYQVWCLCSGIAAVGVIRLLRQDYGWFYLLNITGDAVFQVAVLIELGRVTLRHNRVTSPRRPLVILLLMTAIFLVGSLARWTSPGQVPETLFLAIRMRQVFSILQFASLLTLIWLSTMRGLRWPGRALQVATGLGFYFLIDLAVTILHTHQSFGRQFISLDLLAAFSYVGVLIYWVICFAQRQVDRQEALQ